MRNNRISDEIMRLNFYNANNDNAYIRRNYWVLNKNNCIIVYYANNDIDYYESNGRHYSQLNHKNFELTNYKYKNIYNKIIYMKQDRVHIR